MIAQRCGPHNARPPRAAPLAAFVRPGFGVLHLPL